MQPVLADHARDGATPSKWPTEATCDVAADRRNGVAQARTLEQMHQGRGLRAGGSYFVLKWLCLSHFRRSFGFEVGNAGRSYAGSDFGNDLDGLENRRRFNEATRGVSGF